MLAAVSRGFAREPRPHAFRAGMREGRAGEWQRYRLRPDFE